MPKDTFGSGEGVAKGYTPLPTPLFGKRPAAQLPPVAALGPLRDGVEAIAVLTKAPPAIAVQSLLAAASLATQGFADVELLHGRCPISLFLLTVAESGERKSACDRLATKAIREIEKERRRRYNNELKAYEAQQAGRAGKDDCVIEENNPFSGSPRVLTEPRDPSLCLSDVTIEGIINQLLIGTPSIAILSDEGGQVLGGYAMKRENKLKSAADFSKFWDGDQITKHRASSRPIVLFGQRIALHLMMQPGVARDALGDATFRDQGLLSRMLTAWPESNIGQRCLSEDAASEDARRIADAALDTFYAQMTEYLETPLPTVAGSDQELAPRLLRLSREARELLLGYYNRVEEAQQDEAAFANIRVLRPRPPNRPRALLASCPCSLICPPKRFRPRPCPMP